MEQETKPIDAVRLIEGLSTVSDMKQRGFALAERVGGLDNETIIDVLDIIIEKAAQGHMECMLVYNGFLISGVLSKALGKRRMSELAAVAQDRGRYHIVSVLVDLPADLDEERQLQPYVEPGPGDVPLGVRKSMARKPDFKTVQKMSTDQDHRVIELLLNNPRLTERDVIKIASARPASSKVLEQVYNHQRWITRYSVKKVIVMNPYTPPSIAVRLLALMSVQDLEEITADGLLGPEVRSAAGAMLRWKRVVDSEQWCVLEVSEE
ncbi:MAG: hypothetical protein V2B18_14055 [Pseudomonadota bacterium]